MVAKMFVLVELFIVALLAFKFVTVELAAVVVAKVVVPVKFGLDDTARAPVMVAFVMVADVAIMFVNDALSAESKLEI